MSSSYLSQKIQQQVLSALNPSIGHNVLCAHTSRLVASNIDPSLLARNLFSNEMISDECYRTVTDRHCGMTSTQRLEYIVHTIRASVKTKPLLFRQFVSVLASLGDRVGAALAEEMMTAYQVQEAVELQGPFHLQAHTIHAMVDDTMEKIIKWQDTRRATINKLDDLADGNSNYWKISMLGFGVAIALVGGMTVMIGTILPLMMVLIASFIARSAAGILTSRINLIEANNYLDHEKSDKREVLNYLRKLRDIETATNKPVSINANEFLNIFNKIQPHKEGISVGETLESIASTLIEFLPCGTDPVIRLKRKLSNELDIVCKQLKKL